MSKALNRFKLAGLGVVYLALAACGDSTKTDTEVGSFMKGQVSGLIYTTETHTGVTDENGAYQYEPGETISFYLGGTKLGQTISASAEIDPMDLVPGSSIPVTHDEVEEFFDTRGDEFGTHALADARHEMLNIMMFLYSADKDKESSNGIHIDPTTHVTFANNSYDLKIRDSRFDNIDGIRHKFYEDYDAGGVNSARLIHRYKALDDFAKYHEVEPLVFWRTLSEYDYNADGLVDDFNEYLLDESLLLAGYNSPNNSNLQEYNQYGERMSYQEFENGTLLWGSTFTRDPHGKILTESWFGGEEGVATYTRDNRGNTLTFSVDHGADGSVEEFYSYSYNSDGLRTREKQDTDGDGIVDQIYVFEYNAAGQQTLYGRDSDADGNLDYINTYVYDSLNNITEYHADTNGDGIINRSDFFEYDANGNRIAERIDSDGDGNMNWIYLYSFDANNNRIQSRYDYNGDGNIDRIYNYSYDANNRITSEIIDHDADGIANSAAYWTYNAQGNLLEFTQDYNADSVIDYRVNWDYDANGNQIAFRLDSNGDGTLEVHHQYIFDANNNRISSLLDFNGDGVTDRRDDFTFDEHGNALSYQRDEGVDGNLERIETYTYSRVSFLGWYIFDD